MTDIPADAPRSEDGHYWWDGTAWQLIQQPDASSAAGNAPAGTAPAAAAAPAATPASSSSEESAAAQVAPPVIAADGVPGEEAIAPDVATA